MKYLDPRHRQGIAFRWAVVLAAAGAFLIAGCEEKKKGAVASQPAVKVNSQEITVQQIEFLLQQRRGLKPEQVDAASRQILERLIDQELALQKAAEMKLDRDPRVMQQLEAASREIVARAYVERVGEAASKPTQEEIQKYYEANPALFKDRRIYTFQELSIEAEPDKLAELKTSLEGSKSINDFVDYLKTNDYRFSGHQAVRAAEQLPLASLGTFAAMKDGQALIKRSANGAQVIVLAGSRSQPVTLAQATSRIEQFLLNERKREIAAKDIKAMREAANIEYIGKFAQAAAPASSAGEMTVAPEASSEPDAASSINDNDRK